VERMDRAEMLGDVDELQNCHPGLFPPNRAPTRRRRSRRRASWRPGSTFEPLPSLEHGFGCRQLSDDCLRPTIYMTNHLDSIRRWALAFLQNDRCDAGSPDHQGRPKPGLLAE